MIKWPFQRLSDLQRSGIKRSQIESFGKKYHIFPSLLLMEKILHHLGCPKYWFYTSFKSFWGIPSGAGFQPSTVTPSISFVKSLPWDSFFHCPSLSSKVVENIWFLHIGTTIFQPQQRYIAKHTTFKCKSRSFWRNDFGKQNVQTWLGQSFKVLILWEWYIIHAPNMRPKHQSFAPPNMFAWTLLFSKTFQALIPFVGLLNSYRYS